MKALSRRSVGVLALLVGGWLLVVGGPVGAADASSIDDTGWWSRTNQEPTLGGVLTPPTVSPGQLVVEGAPEGATAIAAIRATLPEGTGSPVLTLEVASESGGGSAVLLACQSGSGWTGAHAGSWDAKPSPDCSQSVQGIPADDGTTWSFALAPLQFEDQLDVVFTPGIDPNLPEGLNGSTFRIVFARPSPASIEVSESSADLDESDFPAPDVDFDSGPGASSGSPGPEASSTSGFGGGSSGSSNFSIPVPPTEESLASQPAQAALPADEQGMTATAPALSAANPLETAAPAAEVGDDGRILGAFVVLVGAGLLVWSTQQPTPAPQLLSHFATSRPVSAAAAAGPAAPAEDVVGGLGRFRRSRHTPARRIGG